MGSATALPMLVLFLTAVFPMLTLWERILSYSSTRYVLIEEYVFSFVGKERPFKQDAKSKLILFYSYFERQSTCAANTSTSFRSFSS